MKISVYSVCSHWYPKLLTRIMQRLNYDCNYTEDPEKTYGSDITIAVPFSNFMRDRSLKQLEMMYKKSGLVAHIQCEQLSNRKDYLEGFLIQSKYCDVIIEPSIEHFEKTKSLIDIPVIHMNTGYHSDLTLVKENKRSYINDWDIFCLDNTILYRDKLYQELYNCGIKSSYGTRVVHSQKIADYSYNSKICLCVHAYGPGSFCPEWKAIFTFMANKGFVILEKNNYPYLEDGKHWVMFDGVEELKEKVQYYLNHQEEREEIAENGYSYIVNNLKFETYVKNTLQELISIKSGGH